MVVSLFVLILIGAAKTREETPVEVLLTEPELTIEVSRKQVDFHGQVSSTAHESILRQRTQSLFPQKTASFELERRPALPPGWALVSEIALRAAAETYSSTIEITPSRIHIRGVVSDDSRWQEGLSRLENNLLPGMRLDHELTEIKSSGSVDRQCISLFRTAMRGRKIEFPHSTARLSSSASPLLDELIQIVADCPDAKIVITGHTDNTGPESGNLALSQSRADAVAAYVIESGIAAERVIASGVGSSQPFVDEDTPQAHQLNRRIDIDIAVPES